MESKKVNKQSSNRLLDTENRFMSSDLPLSAAAQLCFENLNGSCVKTLFTRPLPDSAYGVGLWSCPDLSGNLLVMISVLHFKQLHSPANFLIASLACAGFLVGVTVMLFSTVKSVESCQYFGQSYCKFHSCFEGSFCYASIYHLCFISVNRYIAVSDPLVYPTRFTASVSGICIAFTWFLKLFIVFPFLAQVQMRLG